jgi:hypothetical protein
MKKVLVFAIAVLLLVSATAVAFARNTSTTAVSISAGGISGAASTSLTALDAGDTVIKYKYSTGAGPYVFHAPSWAPIADQAGIVTAGDVYYLDTTGYTGDILVTIYITNTAALQKDYSLLLLQANVWNGTTGAFTQATYADGTAIGTVYLSIVNGAASFILNGNTEYCFTIDGGSYYCIDTDAAGGSLSPSFYLEVQPV